MCLQVGKWMGEQKAYWKTEMNRKEINSLVFAVSHKIEVSLCVLPKHKRHSAPPLCTPFLPRVCMFTNIIPHGPHEKHTPFVLSLL